MARPPARPSRPPEVVELYMRAADAYRTARKAPSVPATTLEAMSPLEHYALHIEGLLRASEARNRRT